MSLYYFEILNKIEAEKVRQRFCLMFCNNLEFARLINNICNEKYSKVDYKMIVDMFNYNNNCLEYQDDVYEKVRVLSENQIETSLQQTKLNESSTSAVLLYILSLQKSKHEMYNLIKTLLIKCDKIELKWVMKIICNKKQVKQILTVPEWMEVENE